MTAVGPPPWATRILCDILMPPSREPRGPANPIMALGAVRVRRKPAGCASRCGAYRLAKNCREGQNFPFSTSGQPVEIAHVELQAAGAAKTLAGSHWSRLHETRP